jgi:hypothetical protein
MIAATPPPPAPDDLSTLTELPSTYQAIHDYFAAKGPVTPVYLRRETFRRIEEKTSRPLVCYVTKTRQVGAGAPAYIDDGDLIGFSDLVHAVQGEAVDLFLISNGGSAEAAERIVRLLRSRFTSLRLLVPSNAYSAATLISFAADELVMGPMGTLGPIDPQINGVPARAILRAFENLETRLKTEGPRALTPYMPLITKYDLHILEICKSAQDLSEELARTWLSSYMLKCEADDDAVSRIIDFFKSYDVHKSHGRSIDRKKAREQGLTQIVDAEATPGLADLLQSLHNQYDLFFDRSPFYKLFEDGRGTNWGRQQQTISVQLPVQAPSQPAPPQP